MICELEIEKSNSFLFKIQILDEKDLIYKTITTKFLKKNVFFPFKITILQNNLQVRPVHKIQLL